MAAAAALVRGAWTTRSRLWAALAAILGLTALAGAACLRAADQGYQAARAVGLDAEPSVALALRMASTLSDMDAAAAGDALTDNAAATGTSRAFREAEQAVAADIVAAARNVTYGETEAAPLRELTWMLALYEEAVGDVRAAGSGSPWLLTRRLQYASRVNRLMAAPAAEALAAANADVLEQVYATYRAAWPASTAMAVAAFAALAVALVAAQLWLVRRFRRVINPPLAAATLLSVFAAAWFVSALASERSDLRVAKADAYDSLNVLFQAKAAANRVRADMSSWLLDPQDRAAATARIEAGFRALSETRIDPRLIAALASALRLEQAGRPADARAATPHLGGLLGKELDNVTFGVAERSAADDSVAAVAAASAELNAIAGDEVQGRHALAVSRWLDSRPGGGAGQFNALRDALDRTIAANQAAFDTNAASALRTAATLPWAVSGLLVLTGLLASAGTWMRLREYR